MKRRYPLIAYMICAWSVSAQNADEQALPLHPLEGLEYKVEMQASLSKEATPLWLNANKHGLSSLEEANGYLRAAVARPTATDSLRRWGVGYGVDLVAPLHYTSDVLVQQAFAEVRWLHGMLSVGSKEYPMQLKNNSLSSGSQTLGINARPVPQVRLALHDYMPVSYTNGWLHLKGHVAYGMMTDQHWQHEFTQKQQSYTDGALFHSKAGYLKIGKEDCYYPLSVEMGLEMAAVFGGTSYVRQDDGSLLKYKGERGSVALWHAFKPDGADSGEQLYTNAAGDLLGSWVARVNYDADTWRLSLYADKFFEDHSSMFQLDYDGYGEGVEWQKSKKHRYLLYDFKDCLVGVELAFKYDHPIRHVLLEYIYTQYQSGPVYHDHTPGESAHIGGDDNYYNHYIYPGWQHWGQVIGNPLYRSPIYNQDGVIEVRDSRFKAVHLGIDGGRNPFAYRLLATYQSGAGTYQHPFTQKHHNVSLLAEGICHIDRGWLKDWMVTAAAGMDAGGILGHHYGLQLTISKKGWLTQKVNQKKP